MLDMGLLYRVADCARPLSFDWKHRLSPSDKALQTLKTSAVRRQADTDVSQNGLA